MSKTLLNIIIMALVLVPAQAVIFNHIVLFNVALAFVFIFVVLRMPVTMSAELAMTIAFLTGLSVDIFADTAGLNALCATVLAFVRRPIYHLYMSIDDDLGGQMPSSRTMGSAEFMKYALTMSLVYCLLYFTIEAFQLFNLSLLLLRIVCSTLFTTVVIYAVDSLLLANRPKRSGDTRK